MTETKKTALLDASQAVKVTDHLDYRDYLRAVYTWLKGHQERYSYLQFADDLGFSKTNVMHLIVVGKRPLTSKAADRVVQALELRGIERRYLETLVAYSNSRKPTEREELFQELITIKNRTLKSALEKSQLEYFSEWYHPIIREMMLLPEFSSDPDWLAAKVTPRIRPEQARKSIELLEKLGLAQFDAKKRRHVQTANQITTGDEISSLAVIRYHQRMIELGKESITAIDELERDISAITVSISPETAQKMKREIQAFRKRLLAMADEGKDPNAVYQLNLQFFPITNLK